MSSKITGIASRIVALEQEMEREFEREINEKRRKLQYSIEKGKIAFDCEGCAVHRKLRQGVGGFLREAPTTSLLIAPVTYSLIVPLLLLDFWVWMYQAVCFPIYRIAKVDRSRYVLLDRGHLQYLNWIERLNCNYCAYANGLIAYTREIASRTEQYFCPIKHAQRRSGAHSRYSQFLDFGDAHAYRKQLAKLRAELRP
jgi:hypothetical protein